MDHRSLTGLLAEHLTKARTGGRVRLVSDGTSREGTVGDLLVIPDARHALEALDDAVVLLTVARR